MLTGVLVSLFWCVLLVFNPDCVCECVNVCVSLAPLERLELFTTLDHLKPSLNRGPSEREPALNPAD